MPGRPGRAGAPVFPERSEGGEGLFVAKTRSGELFSLLGRSKDSLGKIKRETSFFCPACGEPVILKTGAKKVPHFSHYRHCPVKPEGETETHLLGKKWLFEWLEKQGYRPQLEYFLPDLQQRADVFFERAGKKYALEFQCSPLSLSLLTDRDESYRRSGIIPLWIVLDSRIRKEKGPFFSATDFLSFFIREGPASPFILAFRPDPPMFVKYVHLVPVSKSRFYYQKTTFPLSCGMKEVFRSCPPFNVSEFLAVWQREVGRWLIFCHLQRSAKREPALHALYASAIHPTLLPKEVGIPVPRMHAIETHPVLWQALIWLEFFRQRPRGGTFSMEEVKTYLRRSEKTGLVRWRKPVLAEGRDPFSPVKKYLLFLAKCGFARIRGNRYVIEGKPEPLPADRWREEREKFLKEQKALILTLFH
ncbi:MAG: hypothetical protein CW346_08395 [Bacillaceae bacterium]|nr:hypothetical protein [Bacillaceae bacterium]